MKEVELKAALFDTQQELGRTNAALQALVATNLEALGLDKIDTLDELITLIKEKAEK